LSKRAGAYKSEKRRKELARKKKKEEKRKKKQEKDNDEVETVPGMSGEDEASVETQGEETGDAPEQREPEGQEQ